ncbi:ArsR family transcriptional regulator [Gulosibacter massiliensis]|uniref:ArsR family transcriptional regulator n=1 Tax=Gulosibacter massiliensis TaxID=2479839 RepID=UPI000F642FCE|nr:ArsR family transcriptional regulator [Gulosibacter massiliensis]
MTPFVRSDALGALLAETLGHPDERFSFAELARRTGLVPSHAHKELARLVEEGVLVDEREGRNRLVRANREHPLFAAMSELIAATYGPEPVLRELLSGVEGIEDAYLYGSWAARRLGETGAFPGDIDVLVVGTPTRRALAAVAAEASDRVGLEVNVTRVAPEDWASADPTPFIATVKSRPLVPLRLTESGA